MHKLLKEVQEMTEKMIKLNDLKSTLSEMEKVADGDFDVQFVLKLVQTRIGNMQTFEVDIDE